MVAQRQQTADVNNYYRLIAKLAFKYWRRLTPAHRRYIDPEDLINEGVLHFFNSTLPNFDASRNVKLSTYVYVTIEHQMRSLVEKTRVKMRRAPLTELDAMPEEGTLPFLLPASTELEAMLDAEARIEAVLQELPEAVANYLAVKILGRVVDVEVVDCRAAIVVDGLVYPVDISEPDHLRERVQEVADAHGLVALEATAAGDIKLSDETLPAEALQEIRISCEAHGVTIEHFRMMSGALIA